MHFQNRLVGGLHYYLANRSNLQALYTVITQVLGLPDPNWSIDIKHQIARVQWNEKDCFF